MIGCDPTLAVAICCTKAVMSACEEEAQAFEGIRPKIPARPALAGYPRRQMQIWTEIPKRGSPCEAVWDLPHHRRTSRRRTERSRFRRTNCRLRDVCTSANSLPECSAFRLADSGQVNGPFGPMGAALSVFVRHFLGLAAGELWNLASHQQE